MLAAGLAQCRDLGLARVLLTCAADNEPSRRVILANGGIPDGQTAAKTGLDSTLAATTIHKPSAAARANTCRVNCYLYGKRLRAGSRWGVCEQTPECRREHRRPPAR